MCDLPGGQQRRAHNESPGGRSQSRPHHRRNRPRRESLPVPAAGVLARRTEKARRPQSDTKDGIRRRRGRERRGKGAFCRVVSGVWCRPSSSAEGGARDLAVAGCVTLVFAEGLADALARCQFHSFRGPCCICRTVPPMSNVSSPGPLGMRYLEAIGRGPSTSVLYFCSCFSLGVVRTIDPRITPPWGVGGLNVLAPPARAGNTALGQGGG